MMEQFDNFDKLKTSLIFITIFFQIEPDALTIIKPVFFYYTYKNKHERLMFQKSKRWNQCLIVFLNFSLI